MLLALVGNTVARTLDVFHADGVAARDLIHDSGLSALDVVTADGVTNEFGRGGGNVLKRLQLVLRVQRVGCLARRLEFPGLGFGVLDVFVGQVEFRFFKAEVELSGACALDVEVVVGEFGFVALSLGPHFGLRS